MTFITWLRMQASPTSSTTSANNISFSLIFSCKFFYFHAKKLPPLVEFHLYDEAKEMSLHDFCRVCKIPFVGSIEEPHRSDVNGFIDRISVGETRKVSDARITSIHFPVLRYFAIFASRCLTGRGNCGNLSTLILLFCAMPWFKILLSVYALL